MEQHDEEERPRCQVERSQRRAADEVPRHRFRTGHRLFPMDQQEQPSLNHHREHGGNADADQTTQQHIAMDEFLHQCNRQHGQGGADQRGCADQVQGAPIRESLDVKEHAQRCSEQRQGGESPVVSLGSAGVQAGGDQPISGAQRRHDRHDADAGDDKRSRSCPDRVIKPASPGKAEYGANSVEERRVNHGDFNDCADGMEALLNDPHASFPMKLGNPCGIPQSFDQNVQTANACSGVFCEPPRPVISAIMQSNQLSSPV